MVICYAPAPRVSSQMDYFIDALLQGRITDDDFGYFVAIADSWRRSGEWLDVTKYKDNGKRFSVIGNAAEGYLPGKWGFAFGEC